MKKCLHVDLKGLLPKFDFMCECVKLWKELGVDSLLLEFEDKFPFRSHPAVANESCYTADEYRRLATLCRELDMEIIPLLQCVGHADYILKHPEYAALREADGASIYQFCVGNPDSFRLWCEMADELLEMFPDAKYFHIGADEAEQQYVCRNCGDKDRFTLFAARVSACADYMRERGKKVLLWDDVFRNHTPEESGDLSVKTIPCVWQYRQINEQFVAKSAAASPELWSASLLQDNGEYRGWMGHLDNRLKNIEAWRKLDAKYHSACNIGTVWARIQGQTPPASTLALSFWTIGYWASGAPDPAEYTRRFGREFFGCDVPYALLTALGDSPEEAAVMLDELLKNATRNRHIAEIWQVFNEIDRAVVYTLHCFGANRALLPTYRAGKAPLPVTRNYLDGVRITGEKAAECNRQIDNVLGRFYFAGQLEEFKSSRFTALLEENAAWGEIIRRAQSDCVWNSWR